MYIISRKIKTFIFLSFLLTFISCEKPIQKDSVAGIIIKENGLTSEGFYFLNREEKVRSNRFFLWRKVNNEL